MGVGRDGIDRDSEPGGRYIEMKRSPFETLHTPRRRPAREDGRLARQFGQGRVEARGLRRGRGDPDSIDFFHSSGIDYVSCSPYQVRVARVAAA